MPARVRLESCSLASSIALSHILRAIVSDGKLVAKLHFIPLVCAARALIPKHLFSHAQTSFVRLVAQVPSP